MKRLLATGIMALAMLIPASAANAQSSHSAEDLYGQGVHAYHAGQLQNAMTSLSRAIELGSRDPRVYYFRGLTQTGMGDLQAAEGDFLVGAQLEASPHGRHYAVGRALERVQGGVRLQIEQARSNARFLARQERASAPMRANNADATTPVIPDPSPQQAAPAQTNFPDVSGVDNPGTPFENPIEQDTVKPTRKIPAPQPETQSDADDPFGGQTQPKKKMEDDPFGDADKADAVPPKKDDPFGDAGDAGADAKKDDPFGDSDGKSDAEDKSDDDPFADDDGKTDAEGKTEKPTEEDPFADSDGDAKEPKPTEDKDPFGDDSEKKDAGDEKQDTGDEKKSPPDDPFGDDG